jgi:hypothetical protein
LIFLPRFQKRSGAFSWITSPGGDTALSGAALLAPTLRGSRSAGAVLRRLRVRGVAGEAGMVTLGKAARDTYGAAIIRPPHGQRVACLPEGDHLKGPSAGKV